MAIRLSRREFLLAGTALTLASCGGNGSTSANSGVIVWYETSLAIAPVLEQIIAQYNATKPAVPVVAQPQPDLSIKLLVVIGANDGPNVVIYPRSRAYGLVSRGAAFPFDDFAKRDNISGTMFGSGLWQGGTANGKLWGLPLGADANVLAYNQKLLNAAQVSLQPFASTTAFDAACAKLVRRDAQGHLAQTGTILQGVPFEIWLWQQGADVLSPDGKSTAFDGSQGTKALTWLVNNSNINGGALELNRLISLTTLTQGVQGVFAQGKLGILPASFGTFLRLKQANPAIPIHLATLPTIDGGTPSTMADVIYAFSPDKSANPQPEATWQFIKWLATNADAQAAIYGAGAIPASAPAQQAPSVANDPDAQVMLQALKVARNPQDFDWESDVASQINNAVPQALNGQLSVKQALDQANTQGTQTIQQNLRLDTPA